MGKIKWVKFDPDAALAGIAELTLEERGAYMTVISLIYSRNGNVPDEERLICRHLHCRPQTWRKLRNSLITRGKLAVNAGQIEAKRTANELETARKRMVKGSVLAENRWNINGRHVKHDFPHVMTTTTTTTPTILDIIEQEKSGEQTENGVSASKRVDAPAKKIGRERKRAPRAPMPEDWSPTEVSLKYAADNGIKQYRINQMIRGCRNYHIQHGTMIAGERGLAATWRTWVDNEIKWSNERNGETVDFEPTDATITRGMTREQRTAYAQEVVRKMREEEKNVG
jgi:uncharacterized protein YdaU (DUF1376 family)